MNKIEKYKNNRITNRYPLIQRFRGFWRIITKKNFILVSYDLVDSKEGILMQTQIIVRTDFNTIVDAEALHNAKSIVDEKYNLNGQDS